MNRAEKSPPGISGGLFFGVVPWGITAHGAEAGDLPPFSFALPKENHPEGPLLPLCGNLPSAPCTAEEKSALVQTWPVKGQVWGCGLGKRPWGGSLPGSALGAGRDLYLSLARCRANRNCGIGQRLHGPVSLSAAAPRSRPGSGAGLQAFR